MTEEDAHLSQPHPHPVSIQLLPPTRRLSLSEQYCPGPAHTIAGRKSSVLPPGGNTVPCVGARVARQHGPILRTGSTILCRPDCRCNLSATRPPQPSQTFSARRRLSTDFLPSHPSLSSSPLLHLFSLFSIFPNRRDFQRSTAAIFNDHSFSLFTPLPRFLMIKCRDFRLTKTSVKSN